MRHRVYRSLDQSPALFGIEGSYLIVLVVAGIVIGFLALIIGSFCGKIIGTVAVIIGFVADYFGVMFLQQKFTEKELKRYLSNFGLPKFVRFYPERIDLNADEYFEGPVE